jgi:F0F1-type ATP synthase membrane subunit b/b'
MEQVARALGAILLRAVPTFVLVLLLYIFLKKVFFNPLESLIARRYSETEGALKAAGETAGVAERKTSECQQALQEARAEIFRYLESERQRTLEECDRALGEARRDAEQRIEAAGQQLQADVEAARQLLQGESDELADSIARLILKLKVETAS